mgnify:CR=1 FL=1
MSPRRFTTSVTVPLKDEGFPSVEERLETTPAAAPTSNGSAKHAPEPVAAGGTDKGKARPGRGH